jgi:hypothetical protein
VSDPDFVGVMGDVHANTLWTVSAIKQICKRLEGEKDKIILQAGDFGVWSPPGDETWVFAGIERSRQSYLSAVDDALQENDAVLQFIDGNHENHPLLHELAEQGNYGQIAPRIRWLPRGSRWSWHGKTWLALGGAVSVDKLLRTEGVDWFPQEEITDEQEALAVTGGHADVLLCHDAPASVPLHLGTPPQPWLPMIPKAEDHRERLQRVCEAVKPSWIFHGHYHKPGDHELETAWGYCRAISLDMDGTQGNWGILNTGTMEWEW